jgi:anti-sigma B factor antagonist
MKAAKEAKRIEVEASRRHMAETPRVGRRDRDEMVAEIKERRRELGSGQVTGGATQRAAARASEERATRGVSAISHSTLTLMGELDRDALRAVRYRMVRLLDQGRIRLVIDFTEVSHLDYRGVPWLVSQAEEFRRRGGDVKVAGLSRYLQAIFRAAGAHDAFEVYEGDAREALSQGVFAWLH